ncbi:barstar family protein [Nocardia sp. 2]|uniref:Barstar family protein n=1 Tax=Nocardia acididurans TaxID=2802282 RepID=A0ABS1M4Q3_9NOCA|nr:barstar family protein [Nocardia acididurans]MBL1075030.1 barstar family protein [Nocardia acididurans]
MTEPMPLSQFLSAPADSVAKARPRTGSVPRASEVAAAVSAAPVLGVLPVGAAEFSGVTGAIPAGYLSRELRGRKMRTVEGVYDEFAAAFQFPYYFGENKDAFDECLRDLDEFVGPAQGYVAVIRNAALLLDEEPAERAWFAEAMTDCAARWAKSGTPFRVVLQDAAPAALGAVSLTL